MRASKLDSYKLIIIHKYLEEQESAAQLAKEFNTSKPSIIKFLKRHDVKTRGPKEARQIRAKKDNALYCQKEIQVCTQCNQAKPLTLDYFCFRNKSGGKLYSECKICLYKRNKVYKEKNKDLLKKKRKDNKNKISIDNKKYYQENKDKIKEQKRSYRKENIEKINAYKRKYNKYKYHNDVSFRIRTILGKSIRSALLKRNSSKSGKSCLNLLPFTIKALIEHLEHQFEDWMNWDNYGIYNVLSWDDSDSSTWTWQIDHIIPHSKFNYRCMEDNAFMTCWSLSNLRPYSSKKNCIEGASR